MESHGGAIIFSREFLHIRSILLNGSAIPDPFFGGKENRKKGFGPAEKPSSTQVLPGILQIPMHLAIYWRILIG